MTNKELIQSIASLTGHSQRLTEQLLAATVEAISSALLADQQVHLRDFGDLEVRHRAERLSVHPQTGERVLIPQKMQVVFKQTPALKEKMNEDGRG